MNEKFEIPIVKHLEDEDNLEKNRDAGLVSGQENLALNISNIIYDHAIKENYQILLFCVSPKKRAIETSKLVMEQLNLKPTKLRVVLDIDNNLREIDQGSFNLPDDYKPGDLFEGLKIASKIFSERTFNPNNPTLDDLNYHFGDPVLQNDGTYEYPELKKYFEKPGESYKEILLRFYSQVIKLSMNIDRFKGSIEPIIFTHGQPHQIFTNLSEVAEKINNEGFTFELGSLPRICWDLYKKKKRGVVSFGQTSFVSIENITNQKMIKILEDEIDYLNTI